MSATPSFHEIHLIGHGRSIGYWSLETTMQLAHVLDIAYWQHPRFDDRPFHLGDRVEITADMNGAHPQVTRVLITGIKDKKVSGIMLLGEPVTLGGKKK